MSALNHEPDGQAPSMTIGEVLDLLRTDFQDLSVSKIRFLEAEGLVRPQRAPSGYRRFSHDDVEQLRLILIAQRDHYLPLRVIKDKLEAGELPSVLSAPAAPTEPTWAPESQSQPEVEVVESEGSGARARTPDIDPQQRFNRRELAQESQLPVDVIKQLETFGVIEADPAGRFTGAHVLLCRAYGVLRGYGVDERHLRQVKNGASRDASIIDQSVVHLRSDDRADVVTSMLQAFSDAHYWLVMCEFSRSAPSGGHTRRPRR